MSKKVMKYSVLRYTPVKAAGEFINIGVLFVDEMENQLHFSYIKKMKRLSVFDDEIDTYAVQRLLKSIDNETSNKMDEGRFELENFIQYYLNGFVFSNPKKIVYEDFAKMVTMLEKTFLKFDYEKKERLSKESERKIFKELCKAQNISLKTGYEVTGKFDEKIKYDFATEKCYIKIFDYSDKKNLRHAINSAKLWAWNARYSDKEVIIIYRYGEQDSKTNKEFNSILKIFNSEKIRTFSSEQMDEAIASV